MRIHQVSVDEALISLSTTRLGLSQREASRRLNEFGPNKIETQKPRPLVLRFLDGFVHFFALILWVGAAIAFFAEWKEPGSGMAALGWAILGVIFINGVFCFWQEYRAEQAILALQKLIPHEAKVYRDSHLEKLSVTGLVPGDVITFEQGDDVPADCRVISGSAVRVNNATVTGESYPQARNSLPSMEEELLRSNNMLFAGTSIYSGEGCAVVCHTGTSTEFGKIAHLTQATSSQLSPLQKEIVRLSRVIALIAFLVGAAVFLTGVSIGIPFWTAAIFALGIIVALVPEGLLPEVTLSLATCSQRMAKRNALIRHLPAVETLGCATVICTDKTGTLTENRMTVRKVFASNSMFSDGDSLTAIQIAGELFSLLCETALNCETATEVVCNGKKTLMGDPMEIALIQFARRHGENKTYERVSDIPFDSDRRRFSSLNRIDGALRLYSKGALEVILPRCTAYMSDSGVQPLSQGDVEIYSEAQKEMADKGLRVLAFAYRDMQSQCPDDEMESDLTLLGLIGLEDPPRAEVAESVKRCKLAGIRVIMITGDHPYTARAIAREIGLVESANPLIVTGTDLRRMSDVQLQIALDTEDIIFARNDADQKMRIVNALKNKKHIVAVTGDGVNDAPALKAAHIGIAMGISGTDVARAASDMVLADDNFASIVAAIEEGRGVFANIRKFLTYVLASNIAELIPCLAFMLFHIPLPLTVMQVLSVDLGTDLAPALALGTESPDRGIMLLPPRRSGKGLFDLALLARSYLFLGAMISAGSLSAYCYILHLGHWHGQALSAGDPLYLQATTACLMGIMCMQAINSSLCRSESASLFQLGFFSNKMLLAAVALQATLMMGITYAPPLNEIFHTAALPGSFWLFILPFMFAMAFMEELRKLVLRRYSRRHSKIVQTVTSTRDAHVVSNKVPHL